MLRSTRGGRVVKKGRKVSKLRGKMTSHSDKRGRLRKAEKAGTKMTQSKGDIAEMMSEDMEAAETGISHLKPEGKKEEVKIPTPYITCI